jgi:hypothetical protein
MANVYVRAALWVGVLLAALPANPAFGANELPVKAGYKWVLNSASYPGSPVVLEVTRTLITGTQYRFTTPWGISDYVLRKSGEQHSMSAYGTGAALMSISPALLYWDFTKPAGATWSNALGQFTVVSKTTTINANGRTFVGCTQIRNSSGLYTFAPGIGLVQFGEGPGAFLLDPTKTTVPLPNSTKSQLLSGKIGLTPNRYAYEPFTYDVMMARLKQTVDAGSTLLVASGEWATLEPTTSQFQLSAAIDMVAIARSHNMPISYTLRVINTVARDVPADLATTAWDDAEMQRRLLSLVDALAPILKGQVKYITIGYEIDGYFAQRAGEVPAFTRLHKLAADRFRTLIPGVQVSTTFGHSALPLLQTTFAQLYSTLDYLALTYSPLRGDFTVQSPSVLTTDFQAFKQVAAHRKIVFQEIAFPTGAASGGTPQLQADFFQRAFDALRQDNGQIAAMNFMMLSDLSNEDTDRFAAYFGLTTPAFKSTIQTLGMFDGSGQPKAGWNVFRTNAPAWK